MHYARFDGTHEPRAARFATAHVSVCLLNNGHAVVFVPPFRLLLSLFKHGIQAVPGSLCARYIRGRTLRNGSVGVSRRVLE